ncbi:hypothetical protein ACFCX4_35885 [Kitasatospora sp. NPDC056327]|uniref:hypothetical protein n=1 Tax=Kitasatospora sp. NPDC056327 TaxID=3345785 RepID=UPI0035DFB2BA
MTEDFGQRPGPESVRLIDFDEAKAVPGIVPGTFVLVVSGEKPYENTAVRLVPLVYVRQPEYWGIEVTGSLPSGIQLPVTAPYTEALPLDGVRGTKGVEVIGAHKRERIDLPRPE